eukprot:scaffold140790_cov28-Tisochrysis_lutea.AAC.1
MVPVSGQINLEAYRPAVRAATFVSSATSGSEAASFEEAASGRSPVASTPSSSSSVESSRCSTWLLIGARRCAGTRRTSTATLRST